MGINVKHKVGRNEPCPCGSGLKFKRCHGDVLKQAVCDRVANEKMVELIRVEQRKAIIAIQQENCELCGHTGEIDYPNDGTKCPCQFITDEERIADEYKKLTEGEKE